MASGQEPAETDTAEVVLKPIPVTDIILQATQVNSLLREKRALLFAEERKEEIKARIDSLQFRLALLREDPRVNRIDELSLRSLDNLDSEWSFLDNLLENEQENLNKLLQEREEQKTQINQLGKRWTLTAETIDPESAAELVIEQINTTLADIGTTLELFETESKFLQEELVEISSGVIFANEILESIQAGKQDLTRSLLHLNHPPIWKEFAGKKDTTIVFQEKRSLVDDSLLELRDFYGQYSGRLWFHLILSLVVLILIIILYRNLRNNIPDEDTPEIVAVKKITQRPVISGLLIIIVLTFILYRNIPDAIALLTAILLLPPVYIILRALITGPARRYIILPLAATIMVEVHRIGYSESLFSRIWLLVIILFCLVVLYRIAGTKHRRKEVFTGRYAQLLMFVGFIAFLMFFTALLANIAGAVTLAEFLTHSIIRSIVISMFVIALVATMNSILTTILHGDYLRKSSIFNQYQDFIHQRFKNLINLVAIYLLIQFTLRIFGIWEPVFAWIRMVFTYDIQIGSMAFSLWDITLFILVIWITIQTSRIVRTIFEGESGIRDRMRRGVPGAMSLLLRISIYTIGFLVAVGAAGVQMDKLAILLGAFGVGIGFGLQNIFNNLVSGIIIAFERPIKEGDIIEVGTLLGTVREIGIRSSVIRTYDGSEVITPNGNLISQDLINWTRTDLKRRGEVLVGVAYGTDPQRVIDLLLEVMRNSDRVLNDPPPLALFTGFGESSLDFRLLFWIADADLRITIQSEIAVLVNQAIVEAGITIPFPQRDLHFKSVDNQILDRIRAQDEIARAQDKSARDQHKSTKDQHKSASDRSSGD
jgi:small-conductance mechanosensitive channel